MDPVGAFPDGEWDSFNRMFSTEEADFAAQLYSHYPFPNEHDEVLNFETPSAFWPSHEANTNMAGVDESSYYSSVTLNSNLHYFSQESSFSSGSSSSSVFFPTSCHENYYFSDSNHIPVSNNFSDSMDFCMMDEKNTGLLVPVFPDDVVEKAVFSKEEMGTDKLGNVEDGQQAAIAVPGNELVLKRKSNMPQLHTGAEDKINTDPSENPKKKSRKNKKNVQSKKSQKLTLNDNDEEDTNAGVNGQSSSSYSSEDDSNASQELNGASTSDSKGSGALNLNGKTKASRGSATDPQSLYARKRRERINERLRILQNLVPNGTKVDISTMLEEAVHYVKFLQIQIKLLSSDDLWMYAPIAFNGMDIGLDRKIFPLL